MELLDELAGKGQTFRRVAHGDGAAASVEVNTRSAGDVAQDAQHLGDVLGTHGPGNRKCLFCLHGVLAAFFQRVWSDKHQGGIYGAPKGPGLRTEQSHGSSEIYVVNAEVHVADS